MTNWVEYRIISGDLSLVVVPAIGGRIVSLTYKNQELLFVHEKLRGEIFNFATEDLLLAKQRLGFRHWGGDKTWVAPQRNWQLGIPPLELDAGQYTMNEYDGGVVMTSPICRETGLQITRQVNLINGTVRLKEILCNRLACPITCGVWNVTQIQRPCSFFIPSSSTGIRSYHHEDSTLPEAPELSVIDGWVKIDCMAGQIFKYGGIPAEGALETHIPLRTGGTIIWRRKFDMDVNAKYAHDSIVEVFNSPDLPYAEAEVHAPLAQLAQGETTTLSQCWTFSG